jgi:hypothetical protein
MARGWESKSVEAQIEEGEQRTVVEPPTPAAIRQLQHQIESLRLSRSRLLQQLELARVSAHREMLQKGLQAIEKELEEISSRQNPTEGLS